MHTLLLLLAVVQPADTSLRSRIAAWRSVHESEVIREYVELLRIPNLASDSANIRRNAAALVRMLERRGIAAQLLEAPGSAPAVYGELPTPGAARTVVLYAHYDGQPVDTARWVSPPWQPVLRDRALFAGGREIPFPAPGARFDPEWRLYARSTGDDKGSIIAQLSALDALRALGVRPSVNLKFFFEGEEEAGSTHIRDMLTRHATLLKADLWLMGDGPVHQTRRQLLSFGVRGDMGLQLTVYGPSRPLHSGHYGNWAPNPDVMLVHLLASLRDEEGRILIDHYLDDVRPISAAERAALATIPPVEEQLLGELRLGRSEGAPTSLAERILLPGLNLSGLSGGRTGSTAANVIVAEATAFVDIRMVPDQRPERVQTLIMDHLRKQGYFVVSSDPDSATRRSHPKVMKAVFSPGYPASRTALDGPAARAVIAAVQKDQSEPLITLPSSGGSDATYIFHEVLGTPIIGVPISNHDNNQHAENENMRLKNLWDGIALYAGVLARLGGEWREAIP
ncbi:MAG TPA: M20/M25/M40 family metallo-hydrolase [Gemmatimonadales bacterium]|jgi:acetylornithine deacetylase/succinyl-diaminopimelate desuccinylase-like protein|nr:M20/M25/M40 family metallo-hydrolase [Gemmatimonadales bacterium]